MAAANSNVQLSNLDFDGIKENLKTYLKSQSTFQDYNFEGSALSTLLNVLAYNTHYNAFYLNMIANEMFMDTSVLRSSVVSHAKLLNYTPKSASAPKATVNVITYDVPTASLTIPKFTKFASEAVEGINYPFVTTDTITVNTTANTATFLNLEIAQGEPIGLTFTYSSATNPKSLFVLPDANIDTSTLLVQVQDSTSNSNIQTFTLANDISRIKQDSRIYFLQEGLTGNYELYFGDNILGKKLIDGNIVRVSYIVTSGRLSEGANTFVLLDTIGSGNNSVIPVVSASAGKEKESIESIKYQAPKAYSSQGRAVSFEDYITAIQQNNLGYSIGSVSVWGGEDNTPPAYGQVFISIKPTSGLFLSDSQKKRLVDDVIKPISVVTVKPTVIDPDYVFIKVTADVVYDQNRTTLTSNQIQQQVRESIEEFATNTLGTFNSTFSYSDLVNAVQTANPSIIANNCKINLVKKFFPIFDVPKRYILNYGVPLLRSVFESGITSSPTLQYYSTGADIRLLTDVYIEEVPFATSGIDSISILNPGFNYTSTPRVVITGDGSGAEARAIVKNGYVSQVNVTNSGNNYTQAIVSFVNEETDRSGTNASAYANIQGRFGSIRSYYFENNVKTILNNNLGTIDYVEGTITLPNFSPYDVNDPLGQFSIIANPKSNIVSSSRNRIIAIDTFDPNSIIVNVLAK
jgi:hypothetical protein